MQKKLRIVLFVALMTAVLATTQPLWAAVTGTILGTVTDPTGAVVPKAQVTLRNVETGAVRKTTTDLQGSYEFLSVPVGENYLVEVEAPGFQKAEQSAIKLLVNQNFRADIHLRVGAVTQLVNVSAQAVQAETTSTQLGDVIENRKMNTLPLNGRSYTDLLGLQAGVAPVTSSAQDTSRPASGDLNPGTVSVNGERESANSFLVNGGDVQEGMTQGASIVPTLDSIQEFRLLTNSFDAEYGKFAGAIVNVLTKSGTNSFHGTVFEYLRNDKLDSRNFFDLNQLNPVNGQEMAGTALGAFKRNQFGGAGGGPILKNRLFFFADYQGTREVRGVSSGNIDVPSGAEFGGNFSDVGTTNYNSLTGSVRGDNAPGDFAQTLTTRLGYSVSAGEPYWTSGCTTTTECVFPGQVIPQSAWSSAAKGMLPFIPTAVGSLGGTPFFSSSANKSTVVDDKGAIRLDLNSERTGNWSAYYHLDNSSVVLPYPAASGNGANVPGFPAITPSRAQQFNLTNTHNFGGSMVNEALVNYTRDALIYDKPDGGFGKLSSLGFVSGGLGLIPVVPADEGSPTVSLNLMGPTWGVPNGSTGQFNNTFQISDNFSKIVGRHTLKLGGDGRYLQINERNTYSENGYIQFSGGETGNDFADYLLGAPDFFNQSSQQVLDSRTRYYGFYAQDTFKVKPSLTLNYGLRWEVSEPFYDTENKIMTIKPGVQSHVYPQAPLGLAYPGDDGLPRGMAPTEYNNWAPRVGLAYSPRSSSGPLGTIFGGPGKTSIRAAFGIYHTSVEDETLFSVVGNPPFGLWYVSPTLVYMEEPYKDRLRNNDPGQRFPYIIPPPGANVSFNDLVPITSVQFYEPSDTLPYSTQYNFNIQREIKNSAILTVGYVGTEGHHLASLYSMNPGNPATCLHIAALYAAAGEAGQGCGPYGEDSIYQIDGQTFNGTRPYSVTSGRALSLGRLDFGENDYFSTEANSNYNALQVSLEKRVGALRLLGAYTWSKSIDNSSGITEYINAVNPEISRAISAFDMAHNFVTSYTYDLPLQRITASSPALVRKLVDGWTLAGITRFSSGQPVNLSQSGDLSLCDCHNANDFPNWTGTPIQFSDPRTSANHQFFSKAPFFSEALGVGGDAARRFFHGPGLNNWDMALHKDTRVTERVSAEFRAEFFNIFNHAQFNNPGGDFASSTFGLVTSARDPRIGQLALKLHF
jgi:hypothetical protein